MWPGSIDHAFIHYRRVFDEDDDEDDFCRELNTKCSISSADLSPSCTKTTLST